MDVLFFVGVMGDGGVDNLACVGGDISLGIGGNGNGGRGYVLV